MDTLGACSTSTTELLGTAGCNNPMPHYVQCVQAPLCVSLCSQTKVTSHTCPPQIVVVGLLPDLTVGRSPLSFYNRFYHPSKTALFLVNWCGRPASAHCPHYSLPMLDKFNQS
ncbi:unnamed protein product [Sphagnum jensenii]|uniref:Uncharacterized protein n=1 Tax=Sphagnum jensenii TaxID=128206 RepID=A0ABP1B9Q1_9BRYO